MVVSMEEIKVLREKTSCGVIDCKKALEEARGDMAQAETLLRKRGLELAAKKSDRVAKEGRIETYVHAGNKMVAVVEINCETDFVARGDDFIKFGKDVAMQIAAMNPKFISEKNVPAEILAAAPDKNQFLKEQCLMNQPFVKDPKITIQDLLNGLIAKLGENIFVGRFVRYKVGESE